MNEKPGKRPTQPFSHLDRSGTARMVNVGPKPVQQRRAVATARLICRLETIRALRAHALPKGDVLAVANIAGIQAAKRTAELIPLCHPLPIDGIDIQFRLKPDRIELTCTVETCAKTGAEMEALTGATVAALTLYDMCKAIDHRMRIDSVRLLEKVKQ